MEWVKPRVFRDPVHDVISFRDDVELGRLICTLIDTPEFQRLRHIRQLGFASVVFHGAEHTRFAHCIGVAHVARRMCARLGSGMTREETMTVVAAALLHDVGHAPFSHAMERVFGFHHEDYSVRTVLDPGTGVHRVLAQLDASFPERVCRQITGEEHHWHADIVSSQFDADRADYLLRDARMTGVEVGRYDLERILLCLEHDTDGLVFDSGAFESMEGYLVARYHMYRLVYFHRAVRGTECALQLAFRRAASLSDAAAGLPEPLRKLNLGETLSPAEFGSLADYHVLALLDGWRNHDDLVLRSLAQTVLARRIMRCEERPADVTAEEDARVLAYIDEHLSENERALFFADEAGDSPYRPYSPSSQESGIRIRESSGRIFPIEERSHLVRGLQSAAYRLRRWYYHPVIAAKVQRLLRDCPR